MSQSIGLNVPVAEFKNICRVCLGHCEKLTSIHKIVFTYGHSLEGPVEKLLLTKVLRRYCNIQIHQSDHKPQNICGKCTNLLANAFNILSLFRLSDLRLKKILKNHSSKIKRSGTMSPQVSSNFEAIGVTSHFVYSDNTFQELKTDQSNIEFEIALSTEDNENIDPLSIDVETEQNRDELDVKKQVLQVKERNWINKSWDHTYCIRQPESFNNVRKNTLKRKVRKSRLKTRRKFMEGPQLKRLLLQYQHESENFSCRFCQGLVFQGMNKVVDHIKDAHPLTDDCILCDKKFSKTRVLLSHVASHAKKRNMVCNKCLIYFKDKELLDAHYKSEEHKNYSVKCHLCTREFRRDFKLKLHIQEVHFNRGQQRTQCSQCGLVLKYRHNLKKHLLTHKEMKERKSFLCEHCAKCFTTSTAVRRHVLIQHQGQIHLRQPYRKKVPIPRKPKKNSENENVFTCDYCPRTFHMKYHFFKHRVSHPECKDIACPLCDRVLADPKEYWQHRGAEHSNYKCDKCSVGFPTNESLAAHKYRVHKTPKKFCSYCPASFKSGHSLKLHEYTHTKEKSLSCQFCPKKFLQGHHLDQHISCMHTKVKKYQCHICNKSFIYNSSFKAHLRVHTGSKPFNCPYCAKSFCDTVSRHKHVKLSHPAQMEQFLAFKKQHQSNEIRLAENLPVNAEDRENEEEMAVLSLANEFPSGNDNHEELPQNAEIVFNEYVFSPRRGLIINSIVGSDH